MGSKISLPSKSLTEEEEEASKKRLLKAARNGNIEQFEQELLKNPNINLLRVTNCAGNNILHVSAGCGHVKFASEVGARHPFLLAQHNSGGETPLHLALKSGHPELVVCCLWDLDLESGRGPHSVVDGSGKSLLYLAAEKGYLDVVKCLLERSTLGATLVQKNHRGVSPIQLCAGSGFPRLFQYLLKHCQKSSLMSSGQGKEALQLAIEGGHDEIANSIIQNPELSNLLNGQENEGKTPKSWEEKMQIKYGMEDDDTQQDNQTGDNALGKHQKVEKYAKLWRKKKKTSDNQEKDKQKETPSKAKENFAARLSEYTNGMLVMATLIATVSFAAAFTMPGGYEGDGPDQGMATLVRKAAFQVFLICNTVSMVTSLLAATFLAQTVAFPDRRSQAAAATFAALVIPVALYSMVVAFGTGVYVVIEPKFRWLGITVLVSSCLMPVYVAFVNLVIIPRISEMVDKE